VKAAASFADCGYVVLADACPTALSAYTAGILIDRMRQRNVILIYRNAYFRHSLSRPLASFVACIEPQTSRALKGKTYMPSILFTLALIEKQVTGASLLVQWGLLFSSGGHRVLPFYFIFFVSQNFRSGIPIKHVIESQQFNYIAGQSTEP